MTPIRQIIVQGILPNLAIYAPIVLVLLVGFILAIVTWKKHPKASLLTILAIPFFMLNLLLSLVVPFLPQFLVYLRIRMNLPIRTVAIASNIVISALGFIGWILILLAIFLHRKPKTKTEQDSTRKQEPLVLE
jgi:hypothetical protein